MGRFLSFFDFFALIWASPILIYIYFKWLLPRDKWQGILFILYLAALTMIVMPGVRLVLSLEYTGYLPELSLIP